MEPPQTQSIAVVSSTPGRNLQLDIQMKTRWDIYEEVKEILKRRGFDVWWSRGRHCTIRLGRRLWLDSRETCNWIIK